MSKKRMQVEEELHKKTEEYRKVISYADSLKKEIAALQRKLKSMPLIVDERVDEIILKNVQS